MENTNWLKQASQPLYPDLLWSRPENKAQAGKLLIIGGSSHGFLAPAGAFEAAGKAGAGTIRVLMPDSLQKTLGKSFMEADFVPSTPSGSFARSALAQLIEGAEWADGVLLAGDFGHNSETAIVLETFLDKFKERVVLAGDSLDYFLQATSPILHRKNTVLVTELTNLQSLAKNNRPNPPLKSAMDLYALVRVLSEWSKESPAGFCTSHNENVVIAKNGNVSTTPVESSNLTELAAVLSVWWLQNPTKYFESLTTAAWDYHGKTDTPIV